VRRWLDSDKPARVVVDHYVDKQWQHKLVGPPRLAAEHIERLMQTHGGGPAGTMRRQRRPVVQQGSAFTQSIQYWRLFHNRFEPAEAISAIGPTVAQRFALFERQGPFMYTVRAFGDGLAPCATRWLRGAIGTSVRCMPDAFYGRSCAEAYRDVKSEPVMDDFDGVVSWPGYGRIRHRYRRLMLPFSSVSGQRWVMSMSQNDPSIELLS
jgi:hypothetical protein